MNYNKIVLGGNLTREPSLSYTPSQTAVVDFGMAINRKWKSKGGENKSEVCFVDCVAFGKTAENINKYVEKGDPFFIEGRLTFDSWTAQDGTKRSKHKVVVESFQFIGGKDASGSQNAQPAACGKQETASDEARKPDEDDQIPF